MGIEFCMRQITPETYRAVVASGLLGEDYVAETDEISKDWDLLYQILSNGKQDPNASAALAIMGGRLLEGEPDDYNGYRVHAPDEVKNISTALNAFPPAELESRYYSLDFTGVYGAEANRPASELDTIQYSFTILRSFYADAAAADDAIAVWME